MGDKDQQTYSVSHPDSLAENNSAGNSHPRRWRRWRRRPRWGPSSPPKCSSGCWPAPLAGSPTRRSFRLQRSPFFTQAMSSSTQSFLCFFAYIMCWLGTHFLTGQMDYTALSLFRSQSGEKWRSVERDTPGPCHHIESEIMSIDGEDGGWQVAGAWLGDGDWRLVAEKSRNRHLFDEARPPPGEPTSPPQYSGGRTNPRLLSTCPWSLFCRQTNVGQEEGGGWQMTKLHGSSCGMGH